MNSTSNLSILSAESLGNLQDVQVGTWGLTSVGMLAGRINALLLCASSFLSQVLGSLLILIVLRAAPLTSKLRTHTFTFIKHLAGKMNARWIVLT